MYNNWWEFRNWQSYRLQLIQEGRLVGLCIAAFALVWIANIYMSLFGLIRQDMKKEKTEIKLMEEKN